MKRIVTVLMIAGMCGPVWAATSDADLQRIESEMNEGRARADALKKKAANYGRELKSLKSNMVKAAGTIQNFESDALALEDRLRELNKAEAEKASRLQARRGQFTQVLMALQRMANHPPEAMIAAPQSPADTIRSTILLRTVVPEIERRAGQLRSELQAVAAARAQTRGKAQELAMAVSGLTENRRHLEVLMIEKTRLKLRADEGSRKAEQRIRDLAGKAKDLRDLMARLEADRRAQAAKAAKDNPDMATKDNVKTTTAAATTGAAGSGGKENGMAIGDFRGKLPFPAIGRLVGRYGQATDAGLTRKGITIETRPGAQVVAPYDGQVMFAGAFKGYGQLLIIEHGEGYHSLLAGLSRIDSVIGQQILSGEPAGIMGGDENEAPILYVELRRNGQPINPLPWLAARKSKVNG